MRSSSFAGRTMLTLWLCGALLLGCSDDGTNQDPTLDGGGTSDVSTTPHPDTVGPLSVDFAELKAYSAVKGTTKVKVSATGNVTKVELMAGGQVLATQVGLPMEISWDTTVQADSVYKVSLRATGPSGNTATSGEVPVVVLNKGKEVTWTDGNSGSINVPSMPYVNQHLRFHWTMPGGMKRVVVVLEWTDSAFKLELATGVGTCPDHGETAGKKVSSTSPLAVVYPDLGSTPSAALATATWFGHVDLVNNTDTSLVGKKAPFTLKAYVMP